MAYSMDFESINKATEVINQLAIFLRTAKVHNINNAAVISATDYIVYPRYKFISSRNTSCVVYIMSFGC